MKRLIAFFALSADMCYTCMQPKLFCKCPKK